MSAPGPELAKDRLVIAVDFGTTFSGVAYAFNVPGKKPDITSIQDWPGLEGYRQPKVPTLIMYDKKDPSKFKWGGQVNWRDQAVRGVKLLLDPEQARPAYFPASSSEEESSVGPKAPVDVAADFIGAIYNHALSVVESASLKDYVNRCRKEYILSVPAVWSDKAKDLTLKAAKKAGIHPVTLIKEPEAAALYTLTTHDHAIKEGDAFVLCDAGGGTVDLITYAAKKIEPRLDLSELVPGSGGMVGSLALNHSFEQAVRDLVGEDQFFHLKKTIGWSKALNDFDKNIKTGFDGNIDDIQYVSFPKANLRDDFDQGLSDNCWEMSGKTLQSIFEHVIKDILRLVDEQVQGAMTERGGQAVKAIFLVGGFGSSRYLKARLDQVYEPKGIQVVQPPDAWGAIVNGAVLGRLSEQASVVSTKAVRHYGCKSWCQYDPVEDFGRYHRFQADDGTFRCEKLSWFIHKGEDLKRDQTIKLPFFRTLDQHYTESDLVFTDSLLYSEATPAAKYPGPEVKPCCKVRADLTALTRQDLRKYRGVDGKIYYKLNYDLVLCTAAANLRFSAEFEGREMGSVEATYD